VHKGESRIGRRPAETALTKGSAEYSVLFTALCNSEPVTAASLASVLAALEGHPSFQKALRCSRKIHRWKLIVVTNVIGGEDGHSSGCSGIKATNIALMFVLRHIHVITLAIDDIASQQVLKLSLLVSRHRQVYAYGTVILVQPRACPLLCGFSTPTRPAQAPLHRPTWPRPSLPLTNIRPAPRSGLTSIVQPSQSISFHPQTTSFC
jgi:hypothetical protein